MDCLKRGGRRGARGVGIRLIKEMLDHAPAELTSPERLLLVVIAEDANDKTREGWIRRSVVAHRMGTTERHVRELLTKLAHRGIEVRVPVGENKHGQPVFANKGRRTTYRVPVFDTEGGADGGS